MKLKKVKMNYKLLAKFLLFIYMTSASSVLAKEKNYIVALVNKDPITFIDLKEKANQGKGAREFKKYLYHVT